MNYVPDPQGYPLGIATGDFNGDGKADLMAVNHRSDFVDRPIQSMHIADGYSFFAGSEPGFGEEPEMGWIFDTETHGQGIASEACLAALGWAKDNLAPTPLWAIIAPENEPSLKLAGRLGFERVSEVVYHDSPTVVLRRPSWAR